MRLTFALGLVAAVVALDSDANANTNAPRDSAATERPDGSEGQPPRWPMRDIAANVMRDASVRRVSTCGSGSVDSWQCGRPFRWATLPSSRQP